ncbi:MAG TPA: ferredoxin family protein [Chloroflexota bacterium]|nr:ferredoxin family protein [Chloroflexota bacterium]
MTAATPIARDRSVSPPAHARRPLDETAWRSKLPRGQVHLIPSRCKGCRLCIEFCPQDVLTLSGAMNGKGYHFPVVAEGKQDACVACGFCALVCPEFAVFAVEIEPTPRTAAAPCHGARP